MAVLIIQWENGERSKLFLTDREADVAESKLEELYPRNGKHKWVCNMLNYVRRHDFAKKEDRRGIDSSST